MLYVLNLEIDVKISTFTNNINTLCFFRYKEIRAAEKAEEQRLEEHERRRREEAVSYRIKLYECYKAA